MADIAVGCARGCAGVHLSQKRFTGTKVARECDRPACRRTAGILMLQQADNSYIVSGSEASAISSESAQLSFAKAQVEFMTSPKSSKKAATVANPLTQQLSRSKFEEGALMPSNILQLKLPHPQQQLRPKGRPYQTCKWVTAKLVRELLPATSIACEWQHSVVLTAGARRALYLSCLGANWQGGFARRVKHRVAATHEQLHCRLKI